MSTPPGSFTTGNATTDSSTTDLELLIGGMTCASCANRIEKKLNKLDGVSATVNYATEKAKVTFGDGVTPEDLIATVEKTGYTAELPGPVPRSRPRSRLIPCVRCARDCSCRRR
ncbi:heavy metal-associated domain-containing protein [Blastococcus brunescens]|uniref:Heavy metal-associated domain-containing protein n=1 Tax=Blastococcus brunescens TaxID=1564165 RepID=A0ABZ1AY72_9ACTN|nr:heavy metal-associated domain-containing protein [Blastococcus sp. BMG 8361]WRL62059.1 heavy metal-associated domain-containing protein [Blastococcus sp. BMG 8361]